MSTAFAGGANRHVNLDPTAGVTIMPHLELCPRCGISKGKKGNARRGLCRDCSDVLGSDRRKWAA